MENNKLSASLISLDLIGLIITDLNKEILYKLQEQRENLEDSKFLYLQTDGENHKIWFLNNTIWDSYLEKKYENITPEMEMTLNERKHFEIYLRNAINKEIDLYKNLNL